MRDGREPEGETGRSPWLSIWLLGGFRAEVDGRPVPDQRWERRKTKALVRILAVVPAHRLHREQLQELLWPETDADAAYGSLRKALHFARHALEPHLRRGDASAFISVQDDVVALEMGRVVVDADTYEREATSALDAGDLPALQAALDLYTGELLPEDRYEEWAAPRREELANLRVRLLRRSAEALAAQEKYGAAIERLQAALVGDPAQEAIHREIMRLYVASGSRHGALRQYQLCRQALAEQYDALPDEETEALYAEIRSQRGTGRSMMTAAPSALPAALRRHMTVELIGRDRALELLLAHLAAASEPGEFRRGTVLVSGEAGVGKTRLVVELVRAAAGEGALVLWGSSHELESRIPYAAFAEALGSWLTGLPANARDPLLQAFPDVVRLAPALGSRGADTEAAHDPRADQARLFASVTALLRHATRASPLLLVLDDLHAADPATIQLLHHLIRIAADEPWLIVGTFREEDIQDGSPLSVLLLGVRRAGLARQLDLLRLAESDCGRFVQALLPNGIVGDEVLARIYALSMGNPLFAGEIVAVLRDRGEIGLRDGRWQRTQPGALPRAPEIPAQIGDLVESRARALGEETVRTLGVAATIGMDVPFQLLSMAAYDAYPGSLPEPAVLDALDRALRARILEDRGETYVFRHPLYREALYARLSRQRRMRLHRSVATALERSRPDDVEALAYHFVRSDDTKRTILYLERAGDRARSLYANEVAQAHYIELLERLVRLERWDDARRAREKLGMVLGAMGRYGDALGHLKQVLEGGGDRKMVTRVAAYMGRLHALAGTPLEGEQCIGPVLATADGAESADELAQLYTALAFVYFACGRYREQLSVAELAVRLAREANNPRLLAEAEGRRGLALMLINETDAAAESFQRAIELGRAAEDFDTLYRSLDNMSTIFVLRGRLTEATEYIRQALRVAEQIGDPASIAFTMAGLASVELLAGEGRAALSLMERAVTISSTSIDGWHRPYVLTAQGNLQLAVGAADARNWFHEAQEIARETGDIHAQRLSLSALARLDTLEGRPDRAIGRLLPVLGGLQPSELSAQWVRWELIDAYIRTGDLQSADELLYSDTWNVATPTQPNVTDVRRLSALLHAARGDLQRAEREFHSALDLARQHGMVMQEADILFEHGSAWLRAGMTPEGTRLLEEARSRYEGMELWGPLRRVNELLTVAKAV